MLDAGKQFNHTRWMVIVTQTDRPRSIRNRCVIEAFRELFVLSFVFLLLLLFIVGKGAGLPDVCFTLKLVRTPLNNLLRGF